MKENPNTTVIPFQKTYLQLSEKRPRIGTINRVALLTSRKAEFKTKGKERVCYLIMKL